MISVIVGLLSLKGMEIMTILWVYTTNVYYERHLWNHARIIFHKQQDSGLGEKEATILEGKDDQNAGEGWGMEREPE